MRIENVILKHLIYDENYTRKVLPYLKGEYFVDRNEKLIFDEVNHFIEKYNHLPTFESLIIEIDKKGLTDDEYVQCQNILKEVEETKDQLSNQDWLLDKTEKFCQDQAIYNAVKESINILDGKNKQLEKGAIPDILSKALAITFSDTIGHDYFEDYLKRYEYYHKKEERISFDLELLNKITNGGLPKSTLNLLVAGTGIGKSLAKCHFSSHYLSIGKNVLYITLEMSEEEICKRIDANLMNIDMDNLDKLSIEEFKNKTDKLKSKTVGKLIVNQYPTCSASVSNFRALIHELNLKKNFVPDIIIIDYLNICASSRIKLSSGSVNSYSYVKAIAEELRGLAVEFKVPLISSVQFNRGANVNSDPDIDGISDSFGIAMTADWIIALISTEELAQLNQLLIKQIKSRYSDKNKTSKFVIGVDKAKMKLYDLEHSAQGDFIPPPEVVYNNFKETKNKFEGFKV